MDKHFITKDFVINNKQDLINFLLPFDDTIKIRDKNNNFIALAYMMDHEYEGTIVLDIGIK